MVVYVAISLSCGKNYFNSDYSGSACIALCTRRLRCVRCVRSYYPHGLSYIPHGSFTRTDIKRVNRAAQVMREQPILMAHSAEHVSLLRRATGHSIVRPTFIHTSSPDARLLCSMHFPHRIVNRLMGFCGHSFVDS